MRLALNEYYLYYVKMTENLEENNVLEVFTNDETTIKRGRGRPKKIRVEIPEEEKPKRRSPRTKEQIEEDFTKQKHRNKKEITAHWRYLENGRYETGGYKDREKHKQFHRDYWREKVRIGWTCPYCDSKHVSNEHRRARWNTIKCSKIREAKGILVIETINEDS